MRIVANKIMPDVERKLFKMSEEEFVSLMRRELMDKMAEELAKKEELYSQFKREDTWPWTEYRLELMVFNIKKFKSLMKLLATTYNIPHDVMEEVWTNMIKDL